MIPYDLRPLRFYMRLRSVWREYAALWALLIFLGGLCVGLYEATRRERLICQIQVMKLWGMGK